MKSTTPLRRPPAWPNSFPRRRKWLWEPSPPLPARGRAITETDAEQTVFYADQQQSFRTPYIHRYLLDVQQEVAHNSVITVSYLGAEGRNGWYFDDINAAPYQTGWASIDAYNAARPYNSGRFGDIYLQRAGLNSNYNAGIVKFQRQMTNGLQILTHYTYSKTLGDRGINGQGTQDTGYNYPQNIIRTYGEETYSHRHRLLFQTTYEPKYAQRLPRYARPALGDWHISAIATWESGDALTVYNGAGNQANDYAPYNGLGNLDMVHNPNFPHSKRTFAEYFDTNAFVVPPKQRSRHCRPGRRAGTGAEQLGYLVRQEYYFSRKSSCRAARGYVQRLQSHAVERREHPIERRSRAVRASYRQPRGAHYPACGESSVLRPTAPHGSRCKFPPRSLVPLLCPGG